MGRGARVVRIAACAAVAALAVSVVPAAWAGPVEARADMLELLEQLRGQYTSPGAGFTFGDGEHEASLSSGTREVLANTPLGATDQVRVGSDTKMFVASVVLQLVHEGRFVLDAPVERYLPGVLRYPADKVPGDPAAYDGRTVTVRQLLQHTGGVPDFADYPYILNPLHQITAPTAQEVVSHGLANGPVFRPGAGWSYSNTAYVMLGMAVERATGRSLGTEITKRIIEPLQLARTFFAERGQKSLSGDFVHGYLTQAVPLDVTWFEPAVWGAAGALVSSARDMNTFMAALLDGQVVPQPELREMQRDVPYGTGGYGLGLVRVPLSCGDAWGHAGFLAGYQTFGLAMPNGRQAFLTLNSTFTVALLPPAHPASAYDLLELALC